MDIRELVKEEDREVLRAELIRCVQEAGREHPEYSEIVEEVLFYLERYRLFPHAAHRSIVSEHLVKLLVALSQYALSVKELCSQPIIEEFMLSNSPEEDQCLYDGELQSLVAHLELIQRINFCAIKILVA